MIKTMKYIAILIGSLFFTCAAPADAFFGDFNSETSNDAAFITAIRQKNDSYALNDGSGIDLERNVALIGVSKSIGSNLQLFGGMDYTLDGEIDAVGFSVTNGYTLIAAAGYALIRQDAYTISIFGGYEYTPKETYENSDLDRKYSLESHDGWTGVLGKYSPTRNCSFFVGTQFLLLSDIKEKRHWNTETYDIDREDEFGAEIGFIFNEFSYFLKGWYRFGMGSGFGLAAGIKLW